MYTFENLKEDVAKEAAALKVHATKEELGRLDFERLKPRTTTECIYGQMTGHCLGERAAELMKKSTCITFDTWKLAEATVFTIWRQTCHTPIEVYVVQDHAKNANLISYLKSETETLDL